MKKILFFYYDKSDLERLSILETVLTEFHFTYTNTLEEGKRLLDENHYEFVMVDFTDTLGKDFLDHLKEKNIEQRIITMSEHLECSVLQGCKDCVQSHNRRRIFKPIDLNELSYTIKRYDSVMCNYMNKFKNILYILKDLIHSSYHHFVYDEHSLTIHPKREFAQSLFMEELIHITELLKKNNIAYHVDENYIIRLLPKE